MCDVNDEWLETTLTVNTSLIWSACSLVSGWPPEGDLPDRQQGTVLWTSWDTSGVSRLHPSDSFTRFTQLFIHNASLIVSILSSHDRKKPFLFYFNIMKCASPLVLLEFQCPTTQVRNQIFLSPRKDDGSSVCWLFSVVLCPVMCGKVSGQVSYIN